MDLTDAQIMQAVQAGQLELFDRLVLRYRGPLLNVAWSKLGDAHWAEEEVQETYLAALAAGGGLYVARGIVAGRIADAPTGTNGFGYDPLFFVDELGMTMAEASLAEKSRVSHRARAFSALLTAVGDRAFAG